MSGLDIEHNEILANIAFRFAVSFTSKCNLPNWGLNEKIIFYGTYFLMLSSADREQTFIGYDFELLSW